MIYIIIPVYNRQEFTRQCLLSLREQTYQKFKVVVIDDGSTDGTAEMLAVEFPEVYVIKGDGNLWWTAATNLGVKYALKNNADYILTLNNDTVATDDFLEKMNYWADITPNALFGAFALDAYSQRPVYGGEIMNWKFDTSFKLIANLPENSRNGIHEVSHFPGRGLLIPREVFNMIGFFNVDKFPHYGADNDFTCKAARAKFKIYCNYDAKLLIYPDENSGTLIRKNKNLKNFMYHLFGKKGTGNLIVYYKFSIQNCPAIFLPQNLLIGTIRRIFGYWMR